MSTLDRVGSLRRAHSEELMSEVGLAKKEEEEENNNNIDIFPEYFMKSDTSYKGLQV